MKMFENSYFFHIIGSIGIFIFSVLFVLKKNNNEDAMHTKLPPKAKPNLPLIGNALYYKNNPPKFLLEQYNKLGSIFSINLAGFETTIVVDPIAMKQFANAPEFVLSAREATSDFGFRYTLGDLNVFVGSSLHRMIVNNYLMPNLSNEMEIFANILSKNIYEMFPNKNDKVNDFFGTTRRIILKTTISYFISDDIYQYFNGNLIEEFMEFQDKVEDATAKAVTLPKFIANLTILSKVKKDRILLTTKISKALSFICNESKFQLGIWLKAFKSLNKNSISAWKQFDTSAKGDISLDEMAELFVGLLFAAHKNPAIAAAQSFILLFESPNYLEEILSDIFKTFPIETANEKNRPIEILKSHFWEFDFSQFEKWIFLDKCIIETLRLSAHSIGAIRKVVQSNGFTLQTSYNKEYTVPFGSYIAVSHIIPHLISPFENPFQFSPNRFSNNKQMNWRDPYILTTFSHGVHHCPGEKFACLLIKLFLCIIFERYEWKINDNKLPSIDFERATLAQRKGKCAFQYIKRW